jgi:hypothetical protein
MSTLYDEVMKKEDREEEEHEDRDVQKRQILEIYLLDKDLDLLTRFDI